MVTCSHSLENMAKVNTCSDKEEKELIGLCIPTKGNKKRGTACSELRSIRQRMHMQ